jgi:hypothetical protein
MMSNADRTNSETVKTEIYQPPVSVLKVWFQKPDVTVLLRPVFENKLLVFKITFFWDKLFRIVVSQTRQKFQIR